VGDVRVGEESVVTGEVGVVWRKQQRRKFELSLPATSRLYGRQAAFHDSSASLAYITGNGEARHRAWELSHDQLQAGSHITSRHADSGRVALKLDMTNQGSSSSDWQASCLNEKSRTPEVVRYRRHCADEYEQAQ
jgi:hypothetical protein